MNQLAEYGALVLFATGAAAAEAGRRSVELPTAANLAVIVAESVTALTMIAPKAVHAVGAVVEVLIFTCHDVAFAMRHGARRPSPD